MSPHVERAHQLSVSATSSCSRSRATNAGALTPTLTTLAPARVRPCTPGRISGIARRASRVRSGGRGVARENSRCPTSRRPRRRNRNPDAAPNAAPVGADRSCARRRPRIHAQLHPLQRRPTRAVRADRCAGWTRLEHEQPHTQTVAPDARDREPIGPVSAARRTTATSSRREVNQASSQSVRMPHYGRGADRASTSRDEPTTTC